MNIINKIIEDKYKEIESQSQIIPIDRLQGSQRLYAIRNFKQSLQRKKIDVIAEIKRKSPSENNIMMDAVPAKIAKSYQANGASAISVLTDHKYFGGNIEFIQRVKSATDLPVLRKDFIISEYQVLESFHAGADAILLIFGIIDVDLFSKLFFLSNELGMHVLVEIHSQENLEKLFDLNPEIIGVNCRDLNTMKTDIGWFKEMIIRLPANCIKIAESGIDNIEDLDYISKLGYDAALVGTSLMKTGRPGFALAELLNQVPV